MAELLIWWTSQNHCDAIGKAKVAWPAYLQTEYESRLGRAGRGRLWSAPEFGAVAVDPWPDTPMATFCANAAGIVIKRCDVAALKDVPGVITNFQLERAP